MISYAILIDAGFIKRKLGTRTAPMTAEVLDRFVEQVRTHAELSAFRLHRVYYYDATPFLSKVKKPLSGEMIDFGATDMAKRSDKLLKEAVRKPYFALRIGETAMRGWKVRPQAFDKKTGTVEVSSDDLVPDITQKGVDMRIGLDIASLSLKKQAQIIVLVTGDSDFVPAMKFARKEGVQLFLAPLGHPIKDTMFDHADLVLDLLPRQILIDPDVPLSAAPAPAAM